MQPNPKGNLGENQFQCALRLSTVKPDTLTDMANQMTEKVGLVHGLPYVADRQGFAATLEQVSGVSLQTSRTLE